MTLDARAASKLQMTEPQVSIMRTEWERTPMATVVKELFRAKLDDLTAERLRKLRICTPEDLKTLQGELNGLELALVVLTSPIVA